MYVPNAFGKRGSVINLAQQWPYLEPGEQQSVRFTLGRDELGSFDQDMQWVVEPGVFQLWVGWSSDEGLDGSFVISGN